MRVANILKRMGWAKDRRRLPGQMAKIVVWVAPADEPKMSLEDA